MIPLFHIFNSLSFFFCLFAASLLYFSYKRVREESLGYFCSAFAFLTVYFFLVSIPGIIINHPFWAQALYLRVLNN